MRRKEEEKQRTQRQKKALTSPAVGLSRGGIVEDGHYTYPFATVAFVCEAGSMGCPFEVQFGKCTNTQTKGLAGCVHCVNVFVSNTIYVYLCPSSHSNMYV